MNETNHVIIIGAEMADMLAAVAAAGEGAEVEPREQNEKPGKKLFITGKGRCNVTNVCDIEGLLGPVISNSKFLYSSFYGFINQDMMDLLEQTGLHLKVERGNWIFPQSDKSSDITSTLSSLIRQAGVKMRLNQKADGLVARDGMHKDVRYSGRIQVADRVIVTTGGLSHSTTGSIGDDLKWALDSGYRPTELSPALVLFEVKGTETVKELQGLSLRNVEAIVYNGKRELYREFGEMLFTHFGANGPVLLSASSFYARAIRKKHLRLVIDLKSVLSQEQLDGHILRDFSDGRNKQLKNVLNHLHPAKLIPVIIARSGVDLDKKVNEVIKGERCGLTETTKSLKSTLTGLRDYKETIITQGDISVKDVNSSIMKSKEVWGLYSAEEILNLDAVTGGFNLQITWSMGWATGRAVASQRRKRGGFLAQQNT